jgi:hypothetical protein
MLHDITNAMKPGSSRMRVPNRASKSQKLPVQAPAKAPAKAAQKAAVPTKPAKKTAPKKKSG